MFTGFASENTPAIQVWDLSNNYASSTVNRRVALSDDCAPIQIFKTGITTTSIYLYLPSAPIEGKQIKIINAMYGGFSQTITLYSSDTSGSGSSSAILVIGAGQTVDICYSKNFISFSSGGGNFQTGWITLNSAPASSANYNAVVLGGSSNTAPAAQAAVFGGNNNTASGTTSIAAGGNNNNASGYNSAIFSSAGSTAGGYGSAIVGGSTNTANGFYDVVVGGDSSGATGGYSAVVGGSTNTASGSNSSVLGSGNSTANGQNSTIVGGRYGTTRAIVGNFVSPASVNPIASAAGVQQSGLLVLGVATTDATATVLRSNTGAATTTNQVILPNNSAYYFRGSVTAGVTGAGNSSMWSFEGGIKRGANAAATSIIQSVINLVAQDSGASAWVLALSADTTNGGLAVTVTGQAATTIRWVCKVETTEMTY